jgi:prepilin-type processing-associated H-X9-DG protein
MAIACNNYAAMFDAFVPAVRYEMRSGTLHRIEWDWVTTFNNQLVAPGPLWNFTDHPGETQQCPEFTGSSNSGGDPFTGYNYNTTYIGGEGLFPNLGWSHFRKGAPPHTCSRASSCAMFGDGGKKGGANKFMRAPLRSEGLGISLEAVYSGGQAFRHARATNIAFVDGHVGAVNKPRPGQLATPQLLNNFMDFPRNGFLSDDDRAYDPK